MNCHQKSSVAEDQCYDPFMSGRLLFGEWLEDRLKDKRWTQAAFAEVVGVAASTVSGWINNTQPPRRRMARAIAEALGVNVNEVLIRAGYPPIDPGYVLREPEREPEEGLDLNNPRLRFFLAHEGELDEEEWQLVQRLIEQFAKH